MAADTSGVYVVGHTQGAFLGQTHAGARDVFVRKYDTAGNEVWTRQFGSDEDDEANDVAVDASGVYVTGYPWGVLPGQTHVGGAWDGFVRKYDPAGNVMWTRQFGTPGADVGRGVAVDASGVYVTGHTRGVFPGETSSGFDDGFVRKYDKAGNEVWTHQFGTGAMEWGVEIAVDDPGVYVTGFTAGVLPGQSSAGGGFVRKFVPDLEIERCMGWPVTIEGTEASETLIGTAGSDVIHGKGGDDILLGRGGDDLICGGDGDDFLGGGPGNDMLLGQGGRDTLRGWVGSDRLLSGSHSDRLNGGDGDDSTAGRATATACGAASGTTRSPAVKATTSCGARTAATSCGEEGATTPSTAATEPTNSTAAPTTTHAPEARSTCRAT